MEFWYVFAAPLWISPPSEPNDINKHGLYASVEVIRQSYR